MRPQPRWLVRKGYYYGRKMWIAYRWNFQRQEWVPWLVDQNSWRGLMNLLERELFRLWLEDARAPVEPRALDR